MALLPSFFVLASSGKYLSVTDNSKSLPSGFLKLDEEDIWSPCVKFAAEPAADGTGLVHIRSCYNNKYLVREQMGNHFWIVACAKKPEEDRTKASCTLFEPLSKLETTTNVVGLCHVQSQMCATHSLSGDTHTQQGMLLVSSRSSDGLAAFHAIDSKSLVVLPRLVSFKTDEIAAKYLCYRIMDISCPYQMFEDGVGIGDQRVAKELFPTSDGNYRVKDLYFDKFWRRSPNWIWGDAESNNYSDDTTFSVVQIDGNVIALKNLGNKNFCGPLTTEGKTNCLNAAYPTLTGPTSLVIEETVLQRKISDLKYRLSYSRIYAEQVVEVGETHATNNSPDQTTNVAVTFSVQDSKTVSWNNSVSIKFGAKLGFTTSVVPFIASGKVELTTEIGYTHQWGGSVVETFTRHSTYSVPVPPSTTIRVSLMCTKAACDVPFDYTQTDLLPSGQWVSTIKHDGMFTGMNSYNFYYQSHVDGKK